MQITANYPLSEITTLKIGGPAKQFTSVSTPDELVKAITEANGRYLVIGGGSNLLVNDEGVDSLIIKNEISGIEQDSLTLKVKSGTVLQDLVNFAIENNLSGLQALTGIPGTVGGAIYGNAGAYGQTISDHLVEVTAYDGENVITLTKNDCGFAYRDSAFKQNKFTFLTKSKRQGSAKQVLTILEAVFKLESGDSKELSKETEEIMAKRLVKYPAGIKCPGSFFKNIVAADLPKEILEKIPAEKIVYGKIPAGSLLEEVGAKGDSLGAIEIAPYHANLFVNQGDGKAEDFYNLAKKYVQLVKEKYGITLEPEVQLINLPSLI